MKKCYVHDINEATLQTVTELFKALGDPTRVKIMNLICEKEHAVNQIVESLNLSQSTVSHQLRVLRDKNLVTSRRDGRTIYYKIADEHVIQILHEAIEHVQH